MKTDILSISVREGKLHGLHVRIDTQTFDFYENGVAVRQPHTFVPIQVASLGACMFVVAKDLLNGPIEELTSKHDFSANKF